MNRALKEAASIEEIAYGSRTYAERLERIEEYAERRVSSTMAAIESAVSAWEAAGRKPPRIAGQISKLKQFYDALRQWEEKSLRSKERGPEARKERLMEFSKICGRFGRRLESMRPSGARSPEAALPKTGVE